MPETIPLLLNVGQVALCLWAGTHSYAAITRFQQYEDVSENAAKISSTAEHELHKTRTTQTSGALTVVVALAWSGLSLTGIIAPGKLTALVISGTITAGILAARSHISNFFTSKSSVPLVQKYNDAIRSSKSLVQVLAYMALTSTLQTIYWLVQLARREE